MKGLSILRERKGMTQSALGEVIGVDGNTISRYERSVVRPSIETIQRFADFFGVSVDELLNGPKKNEFVVTLKFVERLDGGEEMQMSGLSLTVADNGFVGVSGGKVFETRGDIEAVIEDIRWKLEEGFETRERLMAKKKLNEECAHKAAGAA